MKSLDIIAIDGVIFQLQPHGGGISRVWKEYLARLSKHSIGSRLVILDRDGTAPKIDGLRSIIIDAYQEQDAQSRFRDADLLTSTCRRLGASMLVSTYFTWAEGIPSTLFIYDCIPEVLHWDLDTPQWQAKREAISNANSFIVISKCSENDFIKYYDPSREKNVSIIYNAAAEIFYPASVNDISEFRNAYGIQKEYFVVCGHRWPHKNTTLFLKAISILPDSSSFEVIFTGGAENLESEWLPYLEGISWHRLDLSDRELAIAYSGAAALVYPSLYEGFGLPILEAMSCGCPIITCYNSSIPEVAGDCALYVGEHDIFGMVKALERIREPGIRNGLISCGIERAKLFSWDMSTKSLAWLLENMVVPTSKDEAVNVNLSQSLAIKVSALVSTYNSESFLRGCLEDLTGQTLYQKGQLEIIVIDSGSEQNERAIVEEFQRSHSHIVYLRTERETLYAAWNRGISAANGRYLTNANTDDRHREDALELLATTLDAYPEIDLVYSDCYVSSIASETFEQNAHITRFTYPDFFTPDCLLHFQFGIHPMWRRSVHERIGLFDVNLRAAGDWDFNIRFNLAGLKAHHVNEALGLYYVGQNTITHSDDTMGNENALLKQSYRTIENVAHLYAHAGWATDSPEGRAVALLDHSIRAATLSPPWQPGKMQPDAEYALHCHKASRRINGAISTAAIMSVPASSKRILLVGDFFHPSIGGSELYLEEIAVRLRDRGYSVEVACRYHPDRQHLVHRGIPIHQFRCEGNLGMGIRGEDCIAFQDFVLNSNYDAVFILTHPDNWNCVLLGGLPRHARPRLICMPSINAVNMQEWEGKGCLQAVYDILQQMGLLISSTQNGFDAKFIATCTVPQLFIPHAVERTEVTGTFRAQYNIPEKQPLLVNVANFWPVKNQLALLQTMIATPGDWQLVLIGHPVNYPKEMRYFQAVRELAAQDARISIIEGLNHAEAVNAIASADIFLLPSLGESAGPLVILEAMSHGVPWIATPECNAVGDLAGGCVACLKEFPNLITNMLALSETRTKLGSLGQKHWSRMFTWDKVLDAYCLVIENCSVEKYGEFVMPEGLRKENELLQQSFENSESNVARTYTPTISVVIPTFNRCDILKACLDHLVDQTLPAKHFEVIVCDDGSSDRTETLVTTYKAPYSLIYLRQDNNGPASARNMGITRALGTYVLFLNDDALLDPRALEIHLEEHRRLANPKAAVLGLFSMHPEFTDTAKPSGYCLDHSDLIFEYCTMQPDTPYGYDKFYTCNISLRRDFICSTELFDPAFIRMGAEDIELGYRLEQRGCTIYYRPDCRALHAHRLDPKGFGRMFVFRGKGGVLIFSKYNHLPHHYARMTPADAERFHRNHRRLEPLVAQLGECVQKIERLAYQTTATSIPPILERNHSFDFMYLWKYSDEELDATLTALHAHTQNLYQHLMQTSSRSLEETALQLFPVLNFFKWYYDTVGIITSEHLPALMELDRKAGRHGSEASKGASYLVVPSIVPNAWQTPMRRSSVTPLWAAPVCLLDHIPFPVICADEAMLSEKYKFFQRIFQRNIQDGNLMTTMHLGMATNIFDTSQGQAPPELLGVGYYSLLRILEEKPYLEDVCDYIRHLSQGEDWINHVILYTNCPDQGQFDNVSQRDYVMGCANLYRRSAMDEVGLFDIQFAPTQFDDVDHHLRLRLKGWQVLFNGLVEVRHMRNSGGTANANHLANRFKLEKKYDAATADTIFRQGALLDFVEKHPWIRG